MVLDVYKIRSSISSEYKKKQLFRGTWIALLGLIPIVFGGTILPLEQLKRWGLLIFFLGGAFIVWGMLPYRKLCRIEMNPSEVQLDQNGLMTYIENGQPKLIWNLSQIEKIEAAERGQMYGMAVYLKGSQSVTCDYFLPYFNRNSIENLKSML